MMHRGKRQKKTRLPRNGVPYEAQKGTARTTSTSSHFGVLFPGVQLSRSECGDARVTMIWCALRLSGPIPKIRASHARVFPPSCPFNICDLWVSHGSKAMRLLLYKLLPLVVEENRGILRSCAEECRGTPRSYEEDNENMP